MMDFNQKTHDTDVGSHGGQSRQMMEVFENQAFGSIRVLQEAGKTFFCASDVAKALGYVNPYAAVKRHCRGPLTKREGVVQKVNQYGDAGEQLEGIRKQLDAAQPKAEYRKTKSEMQDWLVAQKIVQEILKEDEQKKEQLHEQEVRQEEENRQSSR